MRMTKTLFPAAVAVTLGFGAAQAAAAPASLCPSGAIGTCTSTPECDRRCDELTGNPESYGTCTSRGCCICISAGE